jgi:hypothetical protein
MWVRQLRSSKISIPLFFLIFPLVIFLLSFLPVLGFATGTRCWSGFFYAPFYTTNIFTDSTTPGWQAGLRPEYRVVLVNRQPMSRLHVLTEQSGTLRLLWEVGPARLDEIDVPVEQLAWSRILEKYAPFYAIGLFLVWLGWRRQLFLAMVGAAAIFAAADYWLNFGAGTQSGFEPGAWLTILNTTSKWSTFCYVPLLTLLWATLNWHLLEQVITRQRVRRLLQAVVVAFGAGEIAAYAWNAGITAIFNNPNYVIFHTRTVFWAWLLPLALAFALAVRRRPRWVKDWLDCAGLLIFIVGYLAQTIFDRVFWDSVGAQWWLTGLVLFAFCQQAYRKEVKNA